MIVNLESVASHHIIMDPQSRLFVQIACQQALGVLYHYPVVFFCVSIIIVILDTNNGVVHTQF